MLKPNFFVERDKTVANIIQILASHSEKLGCKFEESSKDPQEMKTVYLDTKTFELNRNFHFFLRIREKPEEYDITFKCRHPDRYFAAYYDLSEPAKDSQLKFKDYKFEEDITTSVQSQASHKSSFISKFSSQAKFESNKMPKLDKFQRIKLMYPDLDVRISPDERLVKVNNFEANEISMSLGHIRVPEGDEIKSEMSIWYSSSNGMKPLIVELDFDCKAIKDPDKTSLELFSFPMIQNINSLFSSLQNEDMVDLAMTKTKTEFAYDNTGIT